MSQGFIDIYGIVQDGTMTRIYGNITAREALSKAFYDDSIAVSRIYYRHSLQAVNESICTLMATVGCPTYELLRHMQFSPEELRSQPDTTVQFYSKPPFNFDDLDLNTVLACLRANEKLRGERTRYQLGVLTEVEGMTTAILLPMIPRATVISSTETIWLHRTCIPSLISWSGFEERWTGFSFRADTALNTQPDTAQPPTVPVPPLAATAPRPTAVVLQLGAPQWALLAPGCWTSGTVAPRVRHKRPDAAWNNLFLLNGWPVEAVVDDILNGAVHPKDVCGRLILEIATVRSDIQIKRALHVLYPIAGVRAPDIKGAYLTKLITNALKAKIGKPQCSGNDPDYLSARARLNSARRKNFVKFSAMYSPEEQA